MADSGSYRDSEGIFYVAPFGRGNHNLSDSEYGRGYAIFSQGRLSINGVIDSAFQGGAMRFATLMDSVGDSSFDMPHVAGTNFGQGLIMSLDSDAQNATGGGGSGSTQYWIG